MDPLSTTANIAAVLGLLDAVCRAGKHTYRVIAAIKQVPEEIQQLRLELEEIDFLLLNVYRYCQKYQGQHPVAVGKPDSAIGHIYTTLQKLGDEYELIAMIVEENATFSQANTKQRLRNMRSKFKLVLGGKLKASFKSLEKYKTQLSLNLQLLAGFNDLLVHDRIGRLSRTLSSLEGGRESKTIPHDRGNSLSLRKDLTQSVSEHASGLPPALDIVGTQTSRDKEQSQDIWSGREEHLQRAALPLMLLKPKIQESLHLLTFHRPGEAQLSTSDANWIRGELEGLLAICHESAATSLRKLPDATVPPSRPSARATAAVSQDNIQQGYRSEKSKEIFATQFLLRESPAGKVSVRVQCVTDLESGSTAVTDIILLLAPNPAIHGEGFLISLSRLADKFHNPAIHRSISSYAVVEPNSPIFECVRSNNINYLRELLKTRQAMPDVRNTENESLLSIAARSLKLEICELLINEGADPNHCRWDGANAIYDVRNAFWCRPTMYNVPKPILNRLLRLFIKAGCDINSVTQGGNPLHFTVSRSLPGSEIIDEGEISSLINLLVCLGCDIEHKNSDGLTPLMYNACIPRWHGVVVLRELLQWGADPHATTNLGEGALHLAIAFSIPGAIYGDAEFNSLRERLALLLNAGCDPNLRDSDGHTPSDFALSSPRTWFQWCFAVEMAFGVSSIENILINEDGSSGGFDHLTSSLNGAESVDSFQNVDDSGSDWESCSGSEDEGSDSIDSSSPDSLCSHPDHIFLTWNGLFPWSIHPPCADCGLPCDLRDIGRRKWQAWRVFRDLKSQMLAT